MACATIAIAKLRRLVNNTRDIPTDTSARKRTLAVLLGRRAMQHRSLAEVYVLQGQTAEAVQQLEFAQKAGDANFYEQSSIDARLREMKQRLIEELKEKRR